MSSEYSEYVWQSQGPAAPDLGYTTSPSFDYAITAQPQGGWMPNDSTAAHLHLHNSHFPTDRQRPSISAPACYMPDLLPPPEKAFHLPSIKLMSYVSKGLPGSRIVIHIRSPQDRSLVSSFRFYMMFFDKLAHASLKYVAEVGQDYRYALSAEVPEPDAQFPYGACSLKVAVADLSGSTLNILDVGKFTLQRPNGQKQPKTAKKTSKKRQASEPAEGFALLASKRVAVLDQPPDQYSTQHSMETQTQYWPPHQQFAQFHYTLSNGHYPPTDYSLQSALPTLLHSQPSNGYGPVQYHDQAQQHFVTSPEPSLDYSVSPRTLQGAPITPNGFTLYSPIPLTQPPPSRVISPIPEQPQLIRTTQLPNQRPFSAQMESPNSGKLLQSNAYLRVIGSINGMLDKWTKEEKTTQRRLVEFERSQTGSVITVTFKQVPPESRSNTNITVSCIWWKSRGEAYITSVDTIRLLEYLVSARFNVQEKNRIRRNLEGYHPLTVAKGRPESDDFFKVVMGYGEPRPRVIEKDIKVFAWKSLNSMLKKVIGKYSADLTSTSAAAAADSLLPPTITARSSLSGASNNESWISQQPSLAQAHLPTNSTQIGSTRSSHDWSAFPTSVTAIATQPGQQEQLSADISFPTSDHGYYDVTPSGLLSNSVDVPTVWDSSSAGLIAQTSSTFSGFPTDFFMDRLHYNYPLPDGLDSKILDLNSNLN